MNLDSVRKYIGGEEQNLRINKLGSKEWQKTKTRVKGAVEEIAKDLVQLYAARQKQQGFVYVLWKIKFPIHGF